MSVVQIDATESQPHVKYEHLVAAAKLVPSAVTIVAHPCDEASLRGLRSRRRRHLRLTTRSTRRPPESRA